MGTAFPTPIGAIGPSPSAKTFGTSYGGVGAARLPADPLFYADLTLENVVVGSRYRVTRHDTGAELATGVAAATTVVCSGLACFANPFQVDIAVRNASGSPAYIPFATSAFMTKAGGSAYVLQQLDE
jgi:hypothetical protein